MMKLVAIGVLALVCMLFLALVGVACWIILVGFDKEYAIYFSRITNDEEYDETKNN